MVRAISLQIQTNKTLLRDDFRFCGNLHIYYIGTCPRKQRDFAFAEILSAVGVCAKCQQHRASRVGRLSQVAGDDGVLQYDSRCADGSVSFVYLNE